MYYYHYQYIPDSTVVEFRLLAKDGQMPALSDLTLFLNDFDLAYGIIRMAIDSAYSDFKISPSALYRRQLPLRPEDCLRVTKLRHESPLELITVVSAVGNIVGAVWGLVQIVDKIANPPSTHEKRELEMQKLKLEIEKLRESPPQQGTRPIDFVDEQEVSLALQKPEVAAAIKRTLNRLRSSPIKIEQMDVTVKRQKPPKERNESKK
jgi:hypothetical protein